jgi:DNA mismatch repair protein MutS
MNETANILRNATAKSLVIMDEVGRGTGTEDGLAIARAVCEYLLEPPSPRTLFATHYRELTRIEHPRMINLSMDVRESAEGIVFPKKLVEGPARASYGIHVAALAGLPESVVERAGELLEEHAASGLSESALPVRIPRDSAPAPLLFEPGDLILESIRDMDIDVMTPLEALECIDRWRRELESAD